MPGKGPPACADGSQVLLPRALCSVTIPATTFPRLQAAVRANRVMDDPRGRPPISMARGEGSRPRVAPRIPARAPRTTSADTWRAVPPKTSGPAARPRRGLPRAAQAAETGYFFASVTGSPHPASSACSHDPCAFEPISTALEPCALRERQMARPDTRRRAARPTGPPIAQNCGARRHPPSCVSEYQRPPALQDAPRLPIRAPGLAMPTAQARMTRALARCLHATRSRFRSDNDASSLPERRIACGFFLFRWHRAYTSDTGNVSPDSDLHRPMGWFPASESQARMTCAPCHGHMCAAGEPLRAAATRLQRSISRIKHDYIGRTDKVRTPRPSRHVANSLSRPPGRRGATHVRVEDERLGRMFWAGRHARYLPWLSEERGPGSEAPPLAWSPLPAPSTRKSGVVHHAIRSDGGLQPRESGSWYFVPEHNARGSKT
jgi:hypothetical protein